MPGGVDVVVEVVRVEKDCPGGTKLTCVGLSEGTGPLGTRGDIRAVNVTVPLKKAPNGPLVRVTPIIEDCPAKIGVLNGVSDRMRLKSGRGWETTSTITIVE